jgi:hypothetical protein
MEPINDSITLTFVVNTPDEPLLRIERQLSRSILKRYPNSTFSLSVDDLNINTFVAPLELTIEQYDQMMMVLHGREKYVIGSPVAILLDEYGFIQDPYTKVTEILMIKASPIMKLISPLISHEVNFLFCDSIKQYNKCKVWFSDFADIIPVQLIVANIITVDKKTINNRIIYCSYDHGVTLINNFSTDVESHYDILPIICDETKEYKVERSSPDFAIIVSQITLMPITKLEVRGLPSFFVSKTYNISKIFKQFQSDIETEHIEALFKLYSGAEKMKRGFIPDIVINSVSATRIDQRGDILKTVSKINYSEQRCMNEIKFPHPPKSEEEAYSLFLTMRMYLGFIRIN